jgi:phage tail sheath protein FI
MPEYLAPGVYVEETSFRAKSIEGVSTTTTGFIGPTRYGPLDIEPDIVTSVVEFERTYGGREKLEFDDGGTVIDNYMWHAVRAFFEEGGKRLYISRIFKKADGKSGQAEGSLPSNSPLDGALTIQARFPGKMGNFRVRFTLKAGRSILVSEDGETRVKSLVNRDVVWIGNTSPLSGDYYVAERDPMTHAWSFTSESETLSLGDLDPGGHDEVRIITVSVTVETTDAVNEVSDTWADLPLDPEHQRAGTPDSFTEKFAEEPSNLAQARTLPIQILRGDGIETGLDILGLFLVANPDLDGQLQDLKSSDRERSVEVNLNGGDDGLRPEAAEYEGRADEDSDRKEGLKQFEDIEDISIVAAPGSTFGYENGYGDQAKAILGSLISHAARMRYRIAVLDSGNGQTISQVRALRGRLDSTYAALYYPWVRSIDPLTRKEINLPPSGFVAGIYARNDINRAVYKAPANEVVNLAVGFEQLLNKSQQDVLNPEGINCFRFFEGRGFRLWGARTISSDPEWKYVNLRRYFAYLERSIDKGTQWAVFEPNGEALWANVRRTIEDFLLNEWQSGALLGDKPEKAFFVKCDRSTMSQNDLDNGRLICLIGVAPLRPAEFVIFRIGQWTADRKL